MSLRVINFNGPKSIRSQLRAILLQGITAGVYQKDQRFPAERTLAERFGISRASVRETIAELISEGVLFRTVGRGTYLVDRSNGLRTTDLSSKHIGSKQIGFLISNDIFQFVQPGYNQILSGAGEVFHQNGFRLVFHSIGEEETFDSSKDWRHSDLDGYIIVGGIRKHLLERLRQQNAPIVLVDLLLANGGMQSVIIDYAMGIRLAVEHLFELGHKEIGFIGFAESTKYESFWRSLEALGLIYHPRFVQFLNPSDLQPSIIAGFKAMQKMLSSPTLPSAVVTTNDLVAVGSIEALTVAGISVPEELSIVGCDDLGQSINPPLTTIRVDWMNVGRTASRVLMERLDGLGTDVASRQVACAVELVVRGSSGVPGPGR